MVMALIRRVEQVHEIIGRMRRSLVRLGKVHSVDTTACTLVVEYNGEDAYGQPVRGLPIPWLQRSTEHRPPSVGESAVVFDPTLGGGGVALVGWPSTARPSVGSGADHVIFEAIGSETGTLRASRLDVDSPDVRIGDAPTNHAALAARVDAEFQRIWATLTSSSVVPALPTSDDSGDAGQPGLMALQALAVTAAAEVQSVSAAQVRIR